jgi:hypothetical protein
MLALYVGHQTLVCPQSVSRQTIKTGESFPGNMTLQQQMPNQSVQWPLRLSNPVRNSLLANDLRIMQFGSVEAVQVRIRAKLAVVTKHSAKLSFLQP